MEKVKQLLWTLLPLVLLCLCINLWWNTRLLMQSSQETMKNIRDASAVVKDYVIAEKARLDDPRNSNAIDAAIQAGAVFKGTGRLLNTQVIPRIMAQLDSSTGSTEQLTAFVRSLNRNTNESFRQLNEILLPEFSMISQNIRLISDKTGEDIASINQEIINLLQLGETTVETVNLRLGDKKFDQLLSNTLELQRGAQRFVDQGGNVMENLSNTTAEFPPVVKRFRKFQPLLTGLSIGALLRQILVP